MIQNKRWTENIKNKNWGMKIIEKIDFFTVHWYCSIDIGIYSTAKSWHVPVSQQREVQVENIVEFKAVRS